ncbi:MAG TPA: hypothetical protein VFD43_05900 [Planctomycetota bacterium]|nr:hypothetical protein [Planctomycetota bacterium]
MSRADAIPELPLAPVHPVRRPALSGLFAENRSQVNGPARFVSLFGMPLWLTDEGLRLRLLPATPHVTQDRSTPLMGTAPATAVTGAHIFLTFEGTATTARLVGVEASPTRAHYFSGSDPSRWVNNVPTWARVRYEDLYPGIDVEVHASNGRPEYDLVLAPDADLEVAVIRVEGAQGMAIEPDGSLRIDTAAGPLRQPPPQAYETRAKESPELVDCHYALRDGSRYGFVVPRRNADRRLVIDPQLAYSTFLGGSGNDNCRDIAVNGSGSAVVVGNTNGATDFPVTPGAFDTVAGDSDNGFVAQLSPDGSTLDFATFLGGSPALGSDYPGAVTVSASGDICVAGGAGTANFPTTVGVFDTTYNGNNDMFVTRLSADGSALVYSTFIGGSDIDFATDVVLDGQDRVCLVGNTNSGDFPVSTNATYSVKGAGSGAVARLSVDGSQLEYGSYLHSAAQLFGLDVDSAGRLHVVGTALNGLAVTPGAIDTLMSFGEGLLAVMDPNSGALDYCSYLGGFSNDFCTSIELDNSGASYIAGSSDSIDFPTTPGAFDPWKNGMVDAFAVKISPDGSMIEWGTFLGGEGAEGDLVDIGLRPDGSVCVAGQVGSTLFPVTPDAFDSTRNFWGGAFLSRLSADGSQLLYSTFMGGIEDVVQNATVAIDVAGSAYVSASTLDDLFPTTPGAFDTEIAVVDSVVFKFAFEPWTDLGQGLGGVAGTPVLVGAGALQPGSAGSLALSGGAPSAIAYLIVGLAKLQLPFKGGTLVPQPLIVLPIPIQPNGSASVSWLSWPAGLPAGAKLYFQVWIIDPLAVNGLSASNGLLAVAPIVGL